MYASPASHLLAPIADTLGVVPDRNQRVKDARGEATKEIEELKAKKEAEFKEFEAQVSSDLRSGEGRELTTMGWGTALGRLDLQPG